MNTVSVDVKHHVYLLKMNIRKYYEVNIFKVLAIIYHRFHVET